MNDNVNYAESCVKRKKDAELKRKKFLLLLAYILIPIALVIITFSVPIFRPFILLPLALSPLALSVIVPLTWCYTEVEYESILSTGILTVSSVFNRRRRKEIVTLKVGDATVLAPIDSSEAAGADKDAVNKYNAVSSPEATGVYLVVWNNDKGEKCALYFEPSDKMLKVMTFFNRATIVTTVNK